MKAQQKHLRDLKAQCSYTFTATISCPILAGKTAEVDAEATPAKHFIITRQFESSKDNAWNVTHVHSGMKVNGPYSKKLARMLCVIWDNLPFDWPNISNDNSRAAWDSFKASNPEWESWRVSL
jgi:hypothetical protein